MFSILNQYGCTERKSLTLKFPNCISQELIAHFVRGYFDGDGSVSLGKRKNKKSQIKLSFCGTFDFLSILETFLPIKMSLRNISNISYLSCEGNRKALIFKNWLYDNATIYLERKLKVFQNYEQI